MDIKRKKRKRTDEIRTVDDDKMMSAANVASVTQSTIYKCCVRPAKLDRCVLWQISIVLGATTLVTHCRSSL